MEQKRRGGFFFGSRSILDDTKSMSTNINLNSALLFYRQFSGSNEEGIGLPRRDGSTTPDRSR